MDGLHGEVHEMHDDEAEEVAAAPDHRARGKLRLHRGALRIFLRAGGPIFDGELDGEDDVQDHRGEQTDAHAPEKFADAFEKRGVFVDVLGWQEDLQISHKMADEKRDHGEAGEGDDPFPADGGEAERSERIQEAGLDSDIGKIVRIEAERDDRAADDRAQMQVRGGFDQLFAFAAGVQP